MLGKWRYMMKCRYCGGVWYESPYYYEYELRMDIENILKGWNI
jgi:hypothetical protein